MRQVTKLTTTSRSATLTKASLVEKYFTVDIFEDGDYFNDGNEEDCDFTDDQGVEALKVFKV